MTIIEKIVGGLGLIGLALIGIGYVFDASEVLAQGKGLLVLAFVIYLIRIFFKKL